MMMKTAFSIRPAALLRASVLALVLPVAGLSVAQAHEPRAGHDAQHAHAAEAVTTANGLTINAPWSRATAKGARVAAGYLVLDNKGNADDVLVSGKTDIAEKVEIHEMAVVDDVMRMRKLDDGLPVKAGESVELKPGSYHLMFMGLKEPLKEGDTFTADLVFEKGGEVPVSFTVRGLGARDSGHGNHGHGAQDGDAQGSHDAEKKAPAH